MNRPPATVSQVFVAGTTSLVQDAIMSAPAATRNKNVFFITVLFLDVYQSTSSGVLLNASPIVRVRLGSLAQMTPSDFNSITSLSGDVYKTFSFISIWLLLVFRLLTVSKVAHCHHLPTDSNLRYLS